MLIPDPPDTAHQRGALKAAPAVVVIGKQAAYTQRKTWDAVGRFWPEKNSAQKQGRR